MVLYNVPRNSRIRYDGEEYAFYHVDGMYSVCMKDGKFDTLPAWAEVEVIGPLDDMESTA